MASPTLPTSVALGVMGLVLVPMALLAVVLRRSHPTTTVEVR